MAAPDSLGPFLLQKEFVHQILTEGSPNVEPWWTRTTKTETADSFHTLSLSLFLTEHQM